MTGADSAQGTDVTTKSGFDLTKSPMELNVAIPQARPIRERVASVRATHPTIRKRSGKAWAILKKNSARHAPPTMPNVIGLFIRDTCRLAHLPPLNKAFPAASRSAQAMRTQQEENELQRHAGRKNMRPRRSQGLSMSFPVRNNPGPLIATSELGFPDDADGGKQVVPRALTTFRGEKPGSLDNSPAASPRIRSDPRYREFEKGHHFIDARSTGCHPR